MKTYYFRVGSATVRATFRTVVDVEVKGLVYDDRRRTWGVIKAEYAKAVESDPDVRQHIRRVLQAVAATAPPANDPFEKKP
jgi:hypothetical protein